MKKAMFKIQQLEKEITELNKQNAVLAKAVAETSSALKTVDEIMQNSEEGSGNYKR